MTCIQVRELLPELAVGVLPEEDRLEVEGHLRWCAGCKKEASDLGKKMRLHTARGGINTS